MKLSELAAMKFEASKAASDQARTLALAGLAVVWLFAGPFLQLEEETQPSQSLLGAGAAFAVALGLDLFQLVTRTIALELNYQFKNRRLDPTHPDPEVPDTRGVNLWTGIFFYLKIVALVVGYGSVFLFFWQQLSGS